MCVKAKMKGVRCARAHSSSELDTSASGVLSFTGEFMLFVGEVEIGECPAGGELACGMLRHDQRQPGPIARPPPRTFPGWGSQCRRSSGARRRPWRARSRPSRRTCGPARPGESAAGASRAAATDLLHLGQDVLVRRQLAVEAEQLLLLLGQALRRTVSERVPLRASPRTLRSTFLALAGNIAVGFGLGEARARSGSDRARET